VGKIYTQSDVNVKSLNADQIRHNSNGIALGGVVTAAYSDYPLDDVFWLPGTVCTNSNRY